MIHEFGDRAVEQARAIVGRADRDDGFDSAARRLGLVRPITAPERRGRHEQLGVDTARAVTHEMEALTTHGLQATEKVDECADSLAKRPDGHGRRGYDRDLAPPLLAKQRGQRGRDAVREVGKAPEDAESEKARDEDDNVFMHDDSIRHLGTPLVRSEHGPGAHESL